MPTRAVAVVLGPPCANAMWRALGPASPLVFAGVVKSLYDLTLLAVFRAVRPPEEQRLAVGLPKPTEANRLLPPQKGVV